MSESGLEKKIASLFFANFAELKILTITQNKKGEWVCWFYAKSHRHVDLKDEK